MHLDLRGTPVWERPEQVTDALARLGPAGAVNIVTENEPRGLVAGIRERRSNGITIKTRRMAEREWHLLVAPSSLSPGHTLEAALRHVHALSALDDAGRAELARASSTHVVRRSQTVVHDNVEWPYIGLVLDGVLAVASGEGSARRRIYYEVYPHEIFGEAEFFDAGSSMGRVIVLSKSARFAKIPRASVRDMCRRYPDLVFHLGEVAAQRKRELIDLLADHGTLPIIARIAQVLVRYAPPARGLAPAISPLPAMTQSLIAASAGTVKEVAARAIAALELRGALRRERGHITYLDRQMLLDIARGQ